MDTVANKSLGLQDETGSGVAVFGTSPAVTTTATTGKQALIITDLIPQESFRVIIESAYSSDILFDWWLINWGTLWRKPAGL